MSRYLVIIEQTSTGLSAYSPDLPGCVATGATREEVEKEMHDAIEFHLEGLRLEGPFHEFNPKSVAHEGTLWCIMVHYGFKICEECAVTNLLC
jgi:predicted RNase H-like HicB family nuclease